MSVSNFILLKQLISFLGITSFGVFNYFTTVLIASMSLTDFGINNSLTTKVFTTKNTKEISSVLLFSIFFQILILITLVLIWKHLDSRLAIYNYNLIIFITIVIFFSKKAWGIVSSALLSIYNVRPLLYISITYTFISLFLLIFDYQLTLEKYLSVLKRRSQYQFQYLKESIAMCFYLENLRLRHVHHQHPLHLLLTFIKH